MQQYAFSLPDGHEACATPGDRQPQEAIAGGFGFAAIQLDDGRIVAHMVDDHGPADRAGMAWGAQITRWNGQLSLGLGL